MKKKNVALHISTAIITIVWGLVYLLSGVQAAPVEILNYWYEALTVFVAAICIAVAVTKKAPLYFLFAFSLGGLFLYLILSRYSNDFSLWWPLLFAGTGCGLFACEIFGKGKFKWKKTGFIFVLFSVILLVGTLTQTIEICLPVCIILSGLAIGVNGFEKKKTKDDEYVLPSKDKKE